MDRDDPNLETVGVPRIWIERSLEAMVLHGTHQEFDCPGDVPEPCGQWCDICKQHIDDDNHVLGHALHCPIEILRLRLGTSAEPSCRPKRK